VVFLFSWLHWFCHDRRSNMRNFTPQLLTRTWLRCDHSVTPVETLQHSLGSWRRPYDLLSQLWEDTTQPTPNTYICYRLPSPVISHYLGWRISYLYLLWNIIQVFPVRNTFLHVNSVQFWVWVLFCRNEVYIRVYIHCNFVLGDWNFEKIFHLTPKIPRDFLAKTRQFWT
jgi:hypothetical protein